MGRVCAGCRTALRSPAGIRVGSAAVAHKGAPMNSQAKSTIGIVFLTVFVSMVGFGIVIPVLPLYAKQAPFQMSPESLGMLIASFSAMQLVAAPIMGKISDRIGRKPVLLISIAGGVVGYLIVGLASAPWMLFLGRMIDGASGGNIATAQSCMADCTTREERSRAMAWIGAAFGLGFVLGPAIGGQLSTISASAPFYFAAGLSVVNALLVAFKLPETLTAEKRAHPDTPAPISEVFADGRGWFTSLMLAAALAHTAGFSFIHVLFALFCGDTFGWSQKETGYALAYTGIVAVFVQGGLLRRLLKKPVEKPVLIGGTLILAASLAFLPHAATLGTFLVVCAAMALGNGLSTPTLSGLASRHIHGKAQGRMLGLMASAGSLGRVIGPLIAVIPLPAAYATLTRTPENVAMLKHSYTISFSVAAGIIFLAAVFASVLQPPPHLASSEEEAA